MRALKRKGKEGRKKEATMGGSWATGGWPWIASLPTHAVVRCPAPIKESEK